MRLTCFDDSVRIKVIHGKCVRDGGPVKNVSIYLFNCESDSCVTRISCCRRARVGSISNRQIVVVRSVNKSIFTKRKATVLNSLVKVLALFQNWNFSPIYSSMASGRDA